MISPHSLQTNVLYAENVTSISWRVFALSSSVYEAARDPQIAALEQLSVSWSNLIKNGYLARCDYASATLWAFELPKTCINQASGRRTAKVLDLLSREVLKELDCGTLQASELDHAHRRPLQSATSNLRTGLGSSQSPRFHGAGSNGDRQEDEGTELTRFGRDQIYDAFIGALLETLSHKLASRYRTIPLSLGLLLFEFDEPIIASCQARSSSKGADSTAAVCPCRPVHIGAEWLPDGRIICVTWRSSALYKLISSSSTAFDGAATVGNVILAPFGLNAAFSQLQHVPNANPTDLTFGQGRGSRLKKQKAVVEMLLRRGIELKKPQEWVSCSLSDERPNAEATEVFQFLPWPRELVYMIDTPAKNDRETMWADPKSVSDPISVAFGLQDLRVPDSMEEDNLETPKLNDLFKSADLYADMLGDILGPNPASGMYPTPPELIRSHGGLHREKVDFSAPTPATTTSGLGYGLEEAVMSPEQTHEEQYDNMDADDLFGDLDMDIHNDILKDDEFGFFDIAQKAHEPREQTGDTALAADTVHDLAETDRHAKDKTVKFEPHLSKDNLIDLPVYHQPPAFDVNTLTTTTQAEAVGHLAKDLHSESPIILQDRLMDEKYKKGGLFNVLSTDLPAMHDPRTQPPSLTAIPLITITEKPHIIADSSSGTSNTDDSDSDSDNASTSNLHGEALDDSMEGVVDIQGQTPKGVENTTESRGSSFVEFASRSRSTTTTNSGPSISNLQRLSALLNLDGKQYMDLAHAVAYQICHWPLSGDSPSPVIVGQTPARHREGDQSVYLHGLDRLSNVSSAASPVRKGRLDIHGECFMSSAPVSERISAALGEIYSHVSRSNLHTCAEFNPGQATATSNSDVPQGPGLWERSGVISAEEQTVQLRTPNVVLRRGETKIVISATALSLWAELGLSPIGSPIYIAAYCFVPDTEMWIRGASSFLKNIEEAFLQLNLGEHSPGVSICSDCRANGAVAVETADSFQAYVQNLYRCFKEFGNEFVQQKQAPGTVMIYIACPSEDTLIVPYFCAAFQQLHRLFSSRQGSRRWNLQSRVLPRSLFVRDFAFSSPPMITAKTLAREVFDLSCQMEDISNHNESLASLAKPLPGKVGFLLQPSSNRRPLDTHLITHVSYSWKPDNPWVSFAFCDDAGGRRWHTSYHLPWETSYGVSHGQSPGPAQTQPDTPTGPAVSIGYDPANVGRRFFSIARDVLKSLAEISEDVMQSQPHTHYIFLVKDSSITRDEMRVWRSLMEQTAKPNGLASISRAYSGAATTGSSTGSVTPKFNALSSVIMNWTVAILDCECPLELSLPNTVSGDRDNLSTPGAGDYIRHWIQDMPTSTPGTPSLASPSLASGGLASNFPGDPASNFPRDPDDRNARLTASNSLAWFLPARSVIVQNQLGKLEIWPTLTLPAASSMGQPGAGAGGAGGRAAAASGGGYLLMTGDDTGNTQEPDEQSGQPRTPKALSLRIIAAKGQLLMDLRQLAEAYRGLATIADIVGLGGTLPWHVAMARRSRVGLGECM